MVRVVAPRFHLDECESEAERVFIEALHERAEAGGWFADTWRGRDNRLILSVCPADKDPQYHCILRTLRVDFDDVTVWFGPDETHQFATDLDPARADVAVLSGQPLSELASRAANWLEREMRRPIVRHEWDRLDRRGTAAVDSGRHRPIDRGARSTLAGLRATGSRGGGHGRAQ